MSDDMWLAVASGLIALVVSVVSIQVQLGGRRRRKRRDIQEELALLDSLGPEHLIVAARIRHRLAVKLEQYEPGARVPKAQSRKSGLLWMLWVVPLTFANMTAYQAGAPIWYTLSVSAIGGAALSSLAVLRQRRREEREQDAAVRGGDEVEKVTQRPPDPEPAAEA